MIPLAKARGKPSPRAASGILYTIVFALALFLAGDRGALAALGGSTVASDSTTLALAGLSTLINPHPDHLSYVGGADVGSASRAVSVPATRSMAGLSTNSGARTLVAINSDGYCSQACYLEAIWTAPPGVTGVVIGATEVQILTGLGSTGSTRLDLYDASGISAVAGAATTFAPTGTPVTVQSGTIAVTPGSEYRFRAYAASSAAVQSQWMAQSFYVRPVVSSDAFWLSPFLRVDPSDILEGNTKTPGYDNPRFWRSDGVRKATIATTAPQVRVAWYNSAAFLLGNYGAAAPLLDGQQLAAYAAPTDGGISYETRTIPQTTATPRKLTIVTGPTVTAQYAAPNAEDVGQFLSAVYVPASAATTIQRQPLRRVVVFSDSKSLYYLANRDDFIAQMGAAGYSVDIGASAGGQSVGATFGTTLSVQSCLAYAQKLVGSKPDILVWEMGRNDFTGGITTPANLVTQIGNALDAIHLISPQTVVYLTTWTTEANQSAQQGVSWETEKANIVALATATGTDALGNATAARTPWVKVIREDRYWTVAEAASNNSVPFTYDGAHLVSEGVARRVHGILGARWPWTPMQLGPTVFVSSLHQGSILGGTPGSVASAGTSPPTVTITGTSVVTAHVFARISTGGALGAALFDVSLDSGRSWPFRGLTTAASVPVSELGLTFGFAAGTYNAPTGTPGAGGNTYQADVGVATWLDQSGNGNHFQVVSPYSTYHFNWVPSGSATLGSQPVLQSPGYPSWMQVTGLSIPAPYTIMAIGVLGSAGGNNAYYGQVTSGSCPTLFSPASNTIRIAPASGSITATPVGGSGGIIGRTMIAVVNGASSSLVIDGVTTTGTLGASTVTACTVGGDQFATLGIATGGQMAAWAIFPRALSSDEILNLTRWGETYFATP